MNEIWENENEIKKCKRKIKNKNKKEMGKVASRIIIINMCGDLNEIVCRAEVQTCNSDSAM